MGLGTSKLEKTLQAEFPGDEKYYGFENYGNTCYGNSVLQSLYHCAPFREQLIEFYNKNLKDKPEDEETLLSSLCELFNSISSMKKRSGVFGPRKFFIKLRKENEMFRGYMQQDAHEFLNYTLNEISEKMEKKQDANEKERGKTLVHRIFEGILTNETKCLTCETKTSRDETFLDLSIDIEQNTSITSCLGHFSQTEMMSNDDKFFCDTCHSKQEAERGIKIKKLPPILVLHLKRFKFIEQVGSYKKLFHRVVFPFELRLSNTTDDAKDPERLYKLFAIVVHIGGGPSAGHYICIIKSYDHWIQFDDESIDIIDENEISKYFGHTNDTISHEKPRSDCGYLLFYQSISTEDDAVLKVETAGKFDPTAPGHSSQEKEPYCI